MGAMPVGAASRRELLLFFLPQQQSISPQGRSYNGRGKMAANSTGYAP